MVAALVHPIYGEYGPPCYYNGHSGWCVTVDEKGWNRPECRDKGGFFMTGLCDPPVSNPDRGLCNSFIV